MPENKRCYICRREEDEIKFLYEEKMIKTSNSYKIAIQKLENKIREKNYFIERAWKIQDKLIKSSATDLTLEMLLKGDSLDEDNPELKNYYGYLTGISGIINIENQDSEISTKSLFDVVNSARIYLQQEVEELENDLSILAERRIERDELFVRLDLEVPSIEFNKIREILYKHEIRDEEQLREFGWGINDENNETYGKFPVYVCWICNSLLERNDRLLK